MKIVYYRLLDKENKNTIVKSEGRKQFIFNPTSKKWVRTGLMLDYFFADVFEESPKRVNDYEIINESEAMKYIK